MQHFVARKCYCTLFMIDFPLNKLKFDCKNTKNENKLKLDKEIRIKMLKNFI